MAPQGVFPGLNLWAAVFLESASKTELALPVALRAAAPRCGAFSARSIFCSEHPLRASSVIIVQTPDSEVLDPGRAGQGMAGNMPLVLAFHR